MAAAGGGSRFSGLTTRGRCLLAAGAAHSQTSQLSAVWANEGGDKVLQHERRAEALRGLRQRVHVDGACSRQL